MNSLFSKPTQFLLALFIVLSVLFAPVAGPALAYDWSDGECPVGYDWSEDACVASYDWSDD